MKTSNLIGAALDFAIAKCEEFKLAPIDNGDNCVYYDDKQDNLQIYSPSNDWAQGGPIIEREGITLERFKNSNKWSAFMFSTGDCEMACDTPLIAAMRCYVASKLGDDVEIPKELI